MLENLGFPRTKELRLFKNFIEKTTSRYFFFKSEYYWHGNLIKKRTTIALRILFLRDQTYKLIDISQKKMLRKKVRRFCVKMVQRFCKKISGLVSSEIQQCVATRAAAAAAPLLEGG